MKKKNIYANNIFWIFVPANIGVSVILYFFDIYFANLINLGLIQSVLAFTAGFCLMQFVITPFITISYTKKIKKALAYFLAGDTTESERTEFVKEINGFPLKKFIETLVVYMTGNFFNLLVYVHVLDFTPSVILVILIGTWFIAYFGGLVDFVIAQSVCSRFASIVIAKGIKDSTVREEKFFGLSLSNVSGMFVVSPIVASAALLFGCAISPKNQLFKMSAAFGFTILIVVFGCVMYFYFLRFYISKVQKSLEVINVDNISDFNYAENSKDFDMSNEITYSIFLTGKTIDMFLKMIEQTKSLNLQFVSESAGLKDSSENTIRIVEAQHNDISSICSSVKTTANLNEEIKKMVGEVNTISVKTDSDVGYCMDAIHSSISKMGEIISTNQTTIRGIKDLANKITTVREIINLIDTVAEQTKIIAFNTEIEAESIKSNDEVFFNLATEIRSLADSTMDLTRQIRNQIKEIQQSTAALVVTGENCTKKITIGNSFMLDLEKRFTDVKNETEKTSQQSTKINAELSLESNVFATVYEKLTDIDSRVQEFNTNSNQVAGILANLQENTKTLERLSFENV